ncbi:VQ motif-containing protein 17-like [Mangifera indica]|uniref:VQ motif-containing protein 17-like n=1 Tax=Mangifera indica TaxID=29780 RepID=UPI001CFBA16F|nr:VQ motif-containing protein 17-like [Mangifera indica]
MHRDSQTISKPKPKIRIIHIFAPEIIKTDVENFRELVQRLTGKPAHDLQQKKSSRNNKKRKNPRAPRKEQEFPRKNNNNNSTSFQENQLQEEKKTARSGSSSGIQGVKEEEEEGVMWSNNGGYLNGFSDFEGFLHEIGEFPLMPLHAFEETQFA